MGGLQVQPLSNKLLVVSGIERTIPPVKKLDSVQLELPQNAFQGARADQVAVFTVAIGYTHFELELAIYPTFVLPLLRTVAIAYFLRCGRVSLSIAALESRHRGLP